jgi:peptide deformylase
MIITDRDVLRIPNDPVSRDEADGIITLLERELIASQRPGIGLAAPQIGIHKRVAIVRTKSHSIDLVNPVVLDSEHGILVRNEGCLSLPGISVDTWRFGEIFFRCDRNLAGVVATGLEALAVQHEVDHLDGILMTDRSSARGVGRNEPCPCGKRTSDGKPIKYKKCHGR